MFENYKPGENELVDFVIKYTESRNGSVDLLEFDENNGVYTIEIWMQTINLIKRELGEFTKLVDNASSISITNDGGEGVVIRMEIKK